MRLEPRVKSAVLTLGIRQSGSVKLSGSVYADIKSWAAADVWASVGVDQVYLQWGGSVCLNSLTSWNQNITKVFGAEHVLQQNNDLEQTWNRTQQWTEGQSPTETSTVLFRVLVMKMSGSDTTRYWTNTFLIVSDVFLRCGEREAAERLPVSRVSFYQTGSCSRFPQVISPPVAMETQFTQSQLILLTHLC